MSFSSTWSSEDAPELSRISPERTDISADRREAPVPSGNVGGAAGEYSSVSGEDEGEHHPVVGATVIEVDGLVRSIESKLLQARYDDEPRRGYPPTIYRVRPSVRGEDPRAYDPQIVSLGPFHHGKDDGGLEEMEKLKRRFMSDLRGRSPGNSVTKYVAAVRECAPRARAQYVGAVDLHPDAFVEMMVLDGCFLVECLVKMSLGNLRRELISANCNRTPLRNDCLLIENQIPFFVLQALLDASTINWHASAGPTELGRPSSPPTLMELAASFLRIKNTPARPASDVHHLLHLFHLSLEPKPAPEPPLDNSVKSRRRHHQVVTRALSKLINLAAPIFYGGLYLVLMCRLPRLSPSSSTERHRVPRMIPCATELREAGIRIRKRQIDDETEASFLEVSFQDGTLEIPLLSVDWSTNSNFRNLMAFEQCCPGAGSYVTSFVILLDNLINTAADVAVLRGCGVIESKLGSDEEVAEMFNTMCRGSYLDYENHYLAPVFRDVKRYCESSRHRWRAKLMHDYFGSPWAVISVVVASVLLLFTGLQAIFAVLSYFNPPRP